MKIKYFFFFFFVASGFCSLLDEVVWSRLAMANYGVTTVSISIVLSVFMLGLAIGSWGAGKLYDGLGPSSSRLPFYLYSIAELLIGVGALAAPEMFALGRSWLLHSQASLASPTYTTLSAICIAMALLPWTICMGATFPLAIAILRNLDPKSEKSFSYLYLANILGSTLGALISAFVLIELWGFKRTLLVALVLNTLVALVSAMLVGQKVRLSATSKNQGPVISPGFSMEGSGMGPLAMLFTIGFVSLAMEVIWIRLYTPFLNNYVYTFATILSVYLASSYIGSLIYRERFISRESLSPSVWILFSVSCSLPLLFTDPRFSFGDDLMRIVGIVFPCILMGLITPQLVDHWAGTNLNRVGFSYGLNIIGCILGPLGASFILIPWLGERMALILLSFVAVWVGLPMAGKWRWRRESMLMALVWNATIFFLCRTPYDCFQSRHPEARIVRDHTATTTALGRDFQRQLLINGRGMTMLTPICKVMVHLPLTIRAEKPKKILIICFGMGTSFRSALSWNADVTTVELVPGVYRLFDFYHGDADRLAKEYASKMIVDDGRRYLERSQDKYDLIVIDTAPPVQSVGSSLLFSREFLSLVDRHLTPDGVLAHWMPGDGKDPATEASFTKSIKAVYPYLRIYGSWKRFGYHYLASKAPLNEPNSKDMVGRMPPSALQDWMEWNYDNPCQMFDEILSHRISAEEIIAKAPKIPPLDDDRPINEYFFLREIQLLRWK